MIGVADPVESGFAASLARPGGNLTGFSFVGRDLVAKGLELLKEAVPTVALVNVLWNPANPGADLVLAHAESVAKRLRVRLSRMKVEHEADLDAALSVMLTRRPDALVIINDALLFYRRGQIIRFATDSRVPTMFQQTEYVREGGLMAYAPDFREMFERAAVQIDKILTGSKPGEIPIEQPTRFKLLINLKTARILRLTIPPSLLLRADEVIQ
jgi:putative ABC transport system substrate-binding protein